MSIKGLDISYSGSLAYKSFTDRLNYLSLHNKDYISPRQFSHHFYKEKPWLELREYVISRDLGYDLGIPGVDILGPVLVHHIIPITLEDVENYNTDVILNPDNCITVSIETHNIIHYGELIDPYVERKPNDHILW